MDKAELKQIRKEVDKALAEVGKKFDLHMKMGNIRYTDAGFTSKIEATKVEGDVSDPEAILEAKFKKDLSKTFLPGITEEDFGKEFDFRGETFRLIGISPKARKYPLLGESKTSKKKYKFPEKVLS